MDKIGKRIQIKQSYFYKWEMLFAYTNKAVVN